jgi:hypothetical protein
MNQPGSKTSAESIPCPGRIDCVSVDGGDPSHLTVMNKHGAKLPEGYEQGRHCEGLKDVPPFLVG